ncbi:hypothetical protein C4D60_Mb05t21500 [Musa balbisiana]|uniref:RING-type E3 ubiquitin transferase n=1 Tax=Musa balbisiana TaxID=52838 RepID=A0A4S8JXU1_MUSBA|nr:hypothetical protein C4D60_Mb05t21500 [Musa balbisiana]
MDATVEHLEQPPPPPHSSSTFITSFPILATTIFGMLTTAFLLVSYYVFVIKCSPSWRRSDILRRVFSSTHFRRHRHLYVPPVDHAFTAGFRGLDPSVIRSIPVVKFTKARDDDDDTDQRMSFRDCAVCLNEFREEERLKLLPNCSHAFHIDCIDTWLQFNAKCPLCRSDIASSPTGLAMDRIIVLAPRSEQSGGTVIEVGDEVGGDQSSSEEGTDPSPRKNRWKYHKVGSMGDECIDVRSKDEQFCVQPIRRSLSMDSSTDRQLYLSVQEILRRKQHCCFEGGNDEGSSSDVWGGDGGETGRFRRSFFSFGRSSRSSVLPLQRHA